MDSVGSLPPGEPATVFYIGQHETERNSPVKLGLLGQAQDLGYDFLTTPITTLVFHRRVVKLISDHRNALAHNTDGPGAITPLVSPLTPADTTLIPEDANSSLVAIVSPWIDLGSENPIIANVSRQVLNMEIAYAAFCGINNIMVHGPISSSRDVQFARAVYEALGLGPYVQLHIMLPMTGELEQDYGDGVHLAEVANDSKADGDDELHNLELFGVWDTWNTIRTMCNYSHKMSIGKVFMLSCSLLPSSLNSRGMCKA